MNKHNCPKCGLPSITVWQKLKLGPLNKVKCKHCGAFITVPWLESMLIVGLGTLTPLFGVLLLIGVVPEGAGIIVSTALLSVGVVLGTLLFFWLYDSFVPLVVKHA
jgi:hypothetical protein